MSAGRFFEPKDTIKIPIVEHVENLAVTIKDKIGNSEQNAILVRNHGFFLWDSDVDRGIVAYV